MHLGEAGRVPEIESGDEKMITRISLIGEGAEGLGVVCVLLLKFYDRIRETCVIRG
jgi:hypothetical protein